MDIHSQRWSPWGRPRGHIMKSLASKPQVLENCPVLGSRTALVFEKLKFCWKTPENPRKFAKIFFCFPQVEIAWKKIFEDHFRLKNVFEDFFFSENTCACVLGPWAREDLSLASEFFCVLGLGLEPCVLDSTSVHSFPAWRSTIKGTVWSSHLLCGR